MAFDQSDKSPNDSLQAEPSNNRENLEREFSQLVVTTSDFASLTEELKHLHEDSDEYWYAMGLRLQKIADERLYRSGGYRSFSDYCTNSLGYSRQHAYKLMKMAQFINEQWKQATTAEQRAAVQRLFSLGFTKLYILHPLPSETIYRLLDEGVMILTNNHLESRRPLESVTIGELKRTFNQDHKASRGDSMEESKLIKLISEQANTLLQLIKAMQNSASYNIPEESLQTLEQHASSIAKGLHMLDGK